MSASDTKTLTEGLDTGNSSSEALVGALRGLYRALHNMSIYPSGHPSVPQAIARAARSFERALDNRDSIVIGIGRDHLVSDHTRLAETTGTLRSLAELLHELDVAALEFHAGLAASELEILVEQLARARQESSKGAELARLVGSELEHLRICPIDYRALSFGKGADRSRDGAAADTWEDLSRALTDPAFFATGAEPDSMAEAVTERIESLEGTGVSGLRSTLHEEALRIQDHPADQRDTVRKRLAEFLNALNPELRRNLLQVGHRRPHESLNLMAEFADTLPAAELIEALSSVDTREGEVPEELVFLLNKLVRIAEAQSTASTALEETLSRWGVSHDVLERTGGMREAMEEVFELRNSATSNPEDYQSNLREISRSEYSGSLQESGARYRDPHDRDDLKMHAAEIAALLLARTDGVAQRPALFGYVGSATELLLRHRRYQAPFDATVAARADRSLGGESEQTKLAAEGYLEDFQSEARLRAILDGACELDHVSEEALGLLGLGGFKALDLVLSRLDRDPPAGVVEGLERFAAGRSQEHWTQVVAHRDAGGWQALKPLFPRLRELPVEVATSLARPLLNHEASRVRRQALISILEIDTTTPPDRYLRWALRDTSPRVVTTGLRGLAELKSRMGIELLANFLAGELPGASTTPTASGLAVELLVEAGRPGHELLCEVLRALSGSVRPSNALRARIVAESLEKLKEFPAAAQALKSWRYSPGRLIGRFVRTG